MGRANAQHHGTWPVAAGRAPPSAGWPPAPASTWRTPRPGPRSPPTTAARPRRSPARTTARDRPRARGVGDAHAVAGEPLAREPRADVDRTGAFARPVHAQDAVDHAPAHGGEGGRQDRVCAAEHARAPRQSPRPGVRAASNRSSGTPGRPRATRRPGRRRAMRPRASLADRRLVSRLIATMSVRSRSGGVARSRSGTTEADRPCAASFTQASAAPVRSSATISRTSAGPHRDAIVSRSRVCPCQTVMGCRRLLWPRRSAILVVTATCGRRRPSVRASTASRT